MATTGRHLENIHFSRCGTHISFPDHRILVAVQDLKAVLAAPSIAPDAVVWKHPSGFFLTADEARYACSVGGNQPEEPEERRPEGGGIFGENDRLNEIEERISNLDGKTKFHRLGW